MKLSIPSGTTSKRIGIFIQDSSSTTGAGLTGLTNGSAGLVCYSWIDTDGNAGGTSQALQSATRGTWTTRGFIEKDATNMPGCYEFGVPDALLAAGVKWAIVMLKGATNMAPLLVEIEVTAVSNQDAVRGGLTALPNANAEAAGGLFTRGTGAGQIEQEDNGKVSINVKQWLRGTIPAVSVTGVPKVDLVDWLGSAPDALSSGKVPADVKLWLAVAMNALIAGRVDSNAQIVGDKTAYALTAGERTSIADALLDETNGVETSWTLRQVLRIMFSVLGGKLDGAATTTIHTRDQADGKNRMTATVDANGNRTAVTLDAS